MIFLSFSLFPEIHSGDVCGDPHKCQHHERGVLRRAASALLHYPNQLPGAHQPLPLHAADQTKVSRALNSPLTLLPHKKYFRVFMHVNQNTKLYLMLLHLGWPIVCCLLPGQPITTSYHHFHPFYFYSYRTLVAKQQTILLYLVTVHSTSH